MSKLIFTKEKTVNSIGYIGGGTLYMPTDLWPRIPKKELYQTHLCTLFSDFFGPGKIADNRSISIFISVEKHKLGGVKDSISSKYTVQKTSDLTILSKDYSQVLVYENNEIKEEYSLSEIVFDKKYFEINLYDKDYIEKEHIFFEENGMGLDTSKRCGIPFFEQDIIYPGPKYSFYLQLLEEDIEKDLQIFQNGIGYFYLDQNIKRLRSGDKAGLFFIQNT